MSAGALVVLVLFLGVTFTLGLYALIQEETSNPRIVDRADAEREARERGGRSDRSAGDQTEPPNADRGIGDEDDRGWGSSGRRDR